MAKKDWRDKGTFGPAVEHMKDGTFIAFCTWCVFRGNGVCTRVSPVKLLTDDDRTPEWCEMRDDMIADAKLMAG